MGRQEPVVRGTWGPRVVRRNGLRLVMFGEIGGISGMIGAGSIKKCVNEGVLGR